MPLCGVFGTDERARIVLSVHVGNVFLCRLSHCRHAVAAVLALLDLFAVLHDPALHIVVGFLGHGR